MNASGEAILNHPGACGHIVYPYTNESQFVHAVSVFAGAGLRASESALLIMEQAHCEPIRDQLQENGFAVGALESAGRLNLTDAAALTATFLFDGIIDEHKFKEYVGKLIEQGKSASPTGRVRVFGEIVNLLWEPDPKSTQRLEELWNQVIECHTVPLLCAYSLGGPRPDALPDSLLACHSNVLD
jgi:hypothetical protein